MGFLLKCRFCISKDRVWNSGFLPNCQVILMILTWKPHFTLRNRVLTYSNAYVHSSVDLSKAVGFSNPEAYSPGIVFPQFHPMCPRNQMNSKYGNWRVCTNSSWSSPSTFSVCLCCMRSVLLTTNSGSITNLWLSLPLNSLPYPHIWSEV